MEYLNEQARKKVNEMLNTVLADEVLLYQKLRNYHWNVKGKNFRQLHELFEEQYDVIAEIADMVAERIAALGGAAMGTLQELRENSRLEETPGKYPEEMEMVQELASDHDHLAANILADSEKISIDPGAQDLLLGIMQKHLKMAWMLRSSLQ